MGYGRRAMNLLIQYYEGKIPSLAEERKEDGQISTLTGDEVKMKSASISSWKFEGAFEKDRGPKGQSFHWSVFDWGENNNKYLVQLFCFLLICSSHLPFVNVMYGGRE